MNDSLMKPIRRMFQINIESVEFKNILKLLLEKEYYKDEKKAQNGIDQKDRKLIDFLYFTFMFEPEVYIEFKELIEKKNQLSFMRDSLIEKIKDKDLSIFEQLKNNYPHLIVYFYDKYRDDDEYKDYMEDMSDYFE